MPESQEITQKNRQTAVFDDALVLLYVGFPKAVQVAKRIRRDRLIILCEHKLNDRLVRMGQIDTLTAFFRLEIDKTDAVLFLHRMIDTADCNGDFCFCLV